jgi:hypothetical protein
MNQNTFCSKCHRIPSQCCCNTAPRELSDDEIMDCIEEKTGHPFNSCDEDLLEFAKAILKKASEK